MTEGAWRMLPGGVEVRIRLTPRGGRDALEGVESLSDGRAVMKMRVRAAPEGGAANEAVRRTLAKALDRPAASLSLKAGATGRIKTFFVTGDPAILSDKLARLMGAETA